MSNKRITDLTELTTPTTDDVFPVVDIATNTTTKVQLGNLPTTTAVTTALATKQDTLVSGTNIKTLNSTSLLGSGNIVLTANPSGVAGAIQFSNGSAFASDAANLFWDDTNNRLGVGTNAPQGKTEINSTGNQLWLSSSGDIYTYLKFSAQGGFASMIFGDGAGGVNFLNNYAAGMWASNKFAFGPSYFAPSAQVHIKGSGSTSATTSLLVQNSAGNAALQIDDDRGITLAGSPASGFVINATGTNASARFGACAIGTWGVGGIFSLGSTNSTATRIATNNIAALYLDTNQSVNVGTVAAVASAQLQVDSTTKGFLPPRMTTTQKNAIASPAAGLVVYDSTTNKLCCYNGSTWNDLF
jgi:hypothetical protein